MPTIVFVLVAYLIGSLSFAVITSKLFGLPDPRTFGSKNPGATNVLRTGKKAAAALTLLGDAAKGWVAVVLAQHFAPAYGLGETAIALVAVAAFLGHVFPVFFGFQGGKGVATALGTLLALNVWLGLGALATWLGAAALWRISSLSALLAAALAPVYAWFLLGPGPAFLAVLLLSAVLIWRHRSNLQNLLAGKEGKIGQGSRPQGESPE